MNRHTRMEQIFTFHHSENFVVCLLRKKLPVGSKCAKFRRVSFDRMLSVGTSRICSISDRTRVALESECRPSQTFHVVDLRGPASPVQLPGTIST